MTPDVLALRQLIAGHDVSFQQVQKRFLENALCFPNVEYLHDFVESEVIGLIKIKTQMAHPDLQSVSDRVYVSELIDFLRLPLCRASIILKLNNWLLAYKSLRLEYKVMRHVEKDVLFR